MKILIIGKKQQMHWPENVAKVLSQKHDCRLFLYNKKTFFSFFRGLSKHKRFKYRAVELNKEIKQFSPDMIFFVSAFHIPAEFYEVAANFPGIKKIAWAGDAFSMAAADRANVLDYLFCSDSGYLKVARNFKCRSFYLPLCADETVFENHHLLHTEAPFFAGDANDIRENYLSAIHVPVNIWGSHWKKSKLRQHNVHNKSLSHRELSNFYNISMAPINMTFSKNIIDGLNFRTFEIGMCGGLIIVNECKDLKNCYLVGKECVTY